MSTFELENHQSDVLFLGPTSSIVIRKFSSFALKFSSNIAAIHSLLAREKQLQHRHVFISDIDQPEWNLQMTDNDMNENFAQIIQDLDDFAIRSRLDSRAAAVEELLMSKDNQGTVETTNNILPLEKPKRKIKTRKNRLPKKKQSGRVKADESTAWREYGATKLQMYECIKCGKVCSSKEAYMSHLVTHDEEPSPPCQYCGNYFQSMLKYEQHIGNLTSEPIYSCVKAECSSKFLSWCRIACHERLHCNKQEYLCQDCNQGFNTLQKCNNHVKEKHLLDTDPFKCSVCSKAFTTKRQLATHSKSHKNPTVFKCPTCPRTFLSKPGLKYHWLMHMKIRPYNCQICEKGFRNKTDLKNHERIHSGERPFTCELCGKSFVEKAALRKHGVVHTGEKNFICSKCGKQFGYKSSLTMHARKCGIEGIPSHAMLEENIDPVQELLDISLLPFNSSKDAATSSQDFYPNYESVHENDPSSQDVFNLLGCQHPDNDKTVFNHIQF